MLGDINPQTIKIDQQAVVYPGRDHVSTLTIKRFDGRKYAPVDLSLLTRVVLVFPDTTPTIAYDSDTLPAVFSWTGSTITIDLSDYAMPASSLPCWLIAFDAEHPSGQVLVDDNDTTLEFDFRNVNTTGTVPAPAVEFLTDAPIDGETYGRKDGAWVTLEAIVSGVASVNGQTGVVMLDAADVGADPAGEAAAQVALHEAAVDPHPQYTTAAEAAAAAPVQSVNGQTGVVNLTAADVGADPVGTANSSMASHLADPDPHDQYTTAINTAMQAALTSGLVHGNNGEYLAALTNTTLRINAVPGAYFESELGALGASVKSFAQQDIALNTIPLAADGLYIRYVALNALGVASFEATPINRDPTRVQLGIVFLSKTGSTVSFIHGTTGPLNVVTMPALANVSYTDRAFDSIAATLPMSPNAALTMALAQGTVRGEAINWGDPTDVNTRVVAAANPMSFLLLDGGLGALAAVPAPVTTFDPTKYWNGSAQVAVPAANNATVQRIMVTFRGTIVVQYGEQVYANLTDAFSALLVAPFTAIFPVGYAVEVARIALRRDGTALNNTNDARIALFGGGGAAGGGGGGGGSGAVDSVNGQTGTVVLDAADVGADPTGTAAAAVTAHEAAADPHPQYLTPAEGNAAYTPLAHVGAGGTAHANVVAAGAAGFMTGADKTKLDGIATGATQNDTDANLKNRANHTGTQLASTISDFAATVRATVLTGLSLADSTVIAATDSVLQAIGKLGARLALAFDRANHTGTQTSSTISDFNSAARAQTEAELVAGSNITITPAGSGATRTLTIAATGGGSSIPATQTVSSSSGTLDLSATTATVILVTLTENITTITLPAGVASTSIERRIKFTQGGAGTYTVAGWPGTMVVEGNGSPPTALTGVGAVTEYFVANDNNTVYRMYIDQGITTDLVGPLGGSRNLVINGKFAVNQRAYVSGTATTAANQYTLDRWRVVTSGQNATFSASGNGNSVTAPAGGLEQVIEGANIAGGTYVMNWTGTATATVGGTARAKGETFTLTANTHVTIRFSGGTVSDVQLEPGSVVTPIEPRPYGYELALCRRYSRPVLGQFMGQSFNATGGTGYMPLDVPMRATPTLSYTGVFQISSTNGTPVNGTSVTLNSMLDAILVISVTTSSGLTAGNAAIISAPAGAYLSAEL